MTGKWEDLPPELAERIDRDIKNGVFFSIEHWPHRVTAIHWRPGDPNALAEAIIEHVQDDMPLDLDGHQYRITRA